MKSLQKILEFSKNISASNAFNDFLEIKKLVFLNLSTSLELTKASKHFGNIIFMQTLQSIG